MLALYILVFNTALNFCFWQKLLKIRLFHMEMKLISCF